MSHRNPQSAKPPSITPSTPVCKYFLRNKCVYGSKCKQLHTKPPSTPNSGASSGTESSKPDRDVPNTEDTPDEQDQSGSALAWGQTATDDTGGASQEDEGRTKSPCIFFAQGLCGRGEDCEFAHTTSSSDSSGRDSDSKPTTTASKKKSEPKICKHYVRGSCRAGDACRLKHILPVDKSVKSSTNVAGSESSESHSDWDSNGPSNGIAGIPASGPEAEDEHVPFSNGTDDAEGDMHHQPDPVFDNADDLYGDGDDQDDNAAGDEYEDKDVDDTSKNVNDANWQEGDGEDGYNGEAETTFTHNEPAISSRYASSRSPKEPSERGSWYGSGWGAPALSSASAPSSASVDLPSRPPERQFLSPTVPQPAPPGLAPSVQPHWSQFADPQADPKIAFCKPHAQVLCTQGAACRFRHFLTPAEYTLLFHDPQPNLWTFSPSISAAPPLQSVNPVSIPVVTVNQIGISGIEAEASVPPTKPKTTSTFKQECKFYQLGTCRNADRCPYEHNQHPVPVIPTSTSTKSDQGWGQPPPRNYRDKFDAPCRFFVEKNYCSRGNECKYRHDKSTDRVVEEAPPAWPSDDNDNNNNNNNNDDDDTKNEAGNGWNDNSGWNYKDDGGGWDATATNTDSWGTSWDNAGNTGDSWSKTTSISQRTKKDECYQFAKEGRCRRGNDCRFSHDLELNENSGGNEWPPEESSEPAPAPWVAQSGPCRFFARGNCRKGKDCPDRHDPPEENPKENPQEEENGWPSDSNERNIEDDTAEENQAQPNDDPPPQEEAHWTASWDIEDTPAEIAPGSINKPCKMFAQGFCRFGDDCSYKHAIDSDFGPSGPAVIMEADLSNRLVSSDADDENDNDDGDDDDQRSSASEYIAASPPIVRDSESEAEGQFKPIIFDHPVVSRFWEQCTILFGEDITPATVTTLADSKKLILSNLPVDIAPADVTRLARPYGKIVETISLDETVHSAVIQIEFEEASQAYQAFKSLDGQEYESNVISATLKGARTVPIKRSVGQKIYAKVMWPKPSARAWSHYPTIGKAKQQAIDLDSVIIRGRAIKASFVSPVKAQKSSFAVLLQNLDPETTKSDLDAVCTQSELITMAPPVYSEDATDKIKSAFDQLGPTEQFDLLPVTKGPTSTAFVTFQSEDVAAEVVSKLQSRPLQFLGKECLTIRGVHYARYCIAKAQFEAIKSEIDNLKEQSDGSHKCTIQYDDHRNGRLVWIRIHTSFDNNTQFADTNSELQRIIQGIVVMSEGREVWNEYFETSSSTNAMEQIQSRTNTFIQCDPRAKRIRIFGSKADQAQAQAFIMKALSKVHDLRNEIDLPRHKLHSLVNGGFKTLQDTIGINKVMLDVVNSKLVVRGSSDEVSKANSTILLVDDGSSSASGSRNTCQICHHSAVNPVLLSCHDAYCSACLRFAIRQTCTAPFQCISLRTSRDGEVKQCPAHVPYAILHDILSTEEDQVLRASWYAYVRSRPHDLFFCPSLDCPAVHRVGDEGVNIKCMLCVSELCMYCKSLAHIGRPCATRA